MSSIKSNNYIELLDDHNDDLQSAEFIDDAQNKDHKPYFKKIGFCTRLSYWWNKEKEIKNHVYRVVKPDKRMYPPVSCSNKIDNMKYGFLLFVPLFLYNQFKYFFNFFYLMLCISQFIKPLKIGFTFTYVGPLAFVVCLSLINELTDEVQRWWRDFEVNHKKINVLDKNGKSIVKKAGNLQVGEIVILNENEIAPADLLILHSDDPDGKVHIKTDQIDGETDIKVRRAVKFSQELISTGHNMQNQQMEVVVDVPNDLIYKFQGAVHKLSIDEKYIERAFPIEVENSVWAQCKITKGTMRGMVVYTGNDTKIMKSRVYSDPKRSKMDDELNWISKLLFLMMVFCAGFMMIIRGAIGMSVYHSGIQFFRYILLLCSIIPLALKINQDLSKLFYAIRINMDKEMKNTTSRNSMIAEDLGRIEYFLTDKTGTLTKNEMIMKKMAVGGEVLDASRLSKMASTAEVACVDQDLHFVETDSVLELSGEGDVEGDKLKKGNEGFNDNNKFYRMIGSILTCHAVFPVVNDKGKRNLESVSPDELSFIEFAENIGFELTDRSDYTVGFKGPDQKVQNFQLLQIFPFTSSRKRMGVILKHKAKIIYILKGADSVMIPFLKSEYRDYTTDKTEVLSGMGLRTLVFATRELGQEEYDAWVLRYQEALASLDDPKSAGLTRKEKIEQEITRLEHDMEFVGITAVEDLLQDNVQDSIATLRLAGIKVWMLTGDKMETAKSISLTTGLYNKQNDTMFILKDVKDKHAMKKTLNDLITEISSKKFKRGRKKKAFLLIDGMSLALATRHGNLNLFLDLASKISAVCCCRCAPSQKREITKAVKISGKRVLGIGDGGNDVGMIEEAHIGVGIAGKEGKQAALSSDYSVGEFQAVVKLLLWHGRLIYVNSSRMSDFLIHRGCIIATMQFAFCLMFHMIDIPLFNGILMFGYATFFTNLPVISIILDEDLTFETMKENPQLYKYLLKGRLLNTKSFIIFVIKAIIQGTLIMYLTYYLFPDNYFDLLTIQFTALIFTELLNTMFLTTRVTRAQVLLIAISLVFYGLTIILLRNVINIQDMGLEFWFKVMIIVLVSWGLVTLPVVLFDCCFPSPETRIYQQQERWKMKRNNHNSRDILTSSVHLSNKSNAK